MPHWLVTYATTEPIQAASAAEAVALAADASGGGLWNAHPAHPDDAEAFDMETTLTAADAGLPLLSATVGPAEVYAYQHRDEDDRPVPVLVVEVDHTEELEVRVYRNDHPLT